MLFQIWMTQAMILDRSAKLERSFLFTVLLAWEYALELQRPLGCIMTTDNRLKTLWRTYSSL